MTPPRRISGGRERIAFTCILFVVYYVLHHSAPVPIASTEASARAADGKTASSAAAGERIGFPIDLVPESARKGPEDHANLPEDGDGVFREENCDTWLHAAGRHEWNCRLEWDEWMLSNAFVRPGDVVAEFGARYGTTSCALSRIAGREGHVFAVEMDPLVHGYLLRNRYEHGCGFHAVLGTVSDAPLFRGRYSGYAGQTTTTGAGRGLPRVAVSDLVRSVGRRINVALIDCEGCIQSVDATGLLDENSGVDLILMEEDGLDSYAEWHSNLQKRQYKCLWYIKDTLHQVEPRATWSVKMRHSAWAHERVLGEGEGKRELPPSCEEYVKAHGFDSTKIDCSTCPV